MAPSPLGEGRGEGQRPPKAEVPTPAPVPVVPLPPLPEPTLLERVVAPRIERQLAEPPPMPAPVMPPEPVAVPTPPPVPAPPRVETRALPAAPAAAPVAPAAPAPAAPAPSAPSAPTRAPETTRVEPAPVTPPAVREAPARIEPRGPAAAPLGDPLGSHDPFKRSGPPPSSTYDPTAPAPAIDLDAARRRAGEIARQGTGNKAPLAFPMPPVPQKKSKMEQAIENARKPDCREAYKSLGLAAVVPLIANEFGEGNCRW